MEHCIDEVLQKSKRKNADLSWGSYQKYSEAATAPKRKTR